LELLLFLSALLAGLLSGDRAVDARQLDRSEFAASFVVEAASPAAKRAAKTALPIVAARTRAPAPVAVPADPEPRSAYRVDERRLE
jgi:hypothetical protein